MNILKSKQGFIALTELLVIIGIVGILTGLAIPTFYYTRRRAQEAVAIDAMAHVIGPACDQYKLLIREYPRSSYGFDKGYGLLSNPYTVGDPRYDRWVRATANGTSLFLRWPNSPWKDKFGKNIPFVILGDDGVRCAVYSRGRDNITGCQKIFDPSHFNQETAKFICSDAGARDDVGYIVNK